MRPFCCLSERSDMFRRVQFAAAWALLVLTAPTAGQESPTAPLQPQPFQAVLNRIRQHAASEEWRAGAFRDEQIEGWLDDIVGKIATATEIADLKVPVRLADVRPIAAEKSAALSQGLLIGRDIDLKQVS